jgi:hypothetical protein
MGRMSEKDKSMKGSPQLVMLIPVPSPVVRWFPALSRPPHCVRTKPHTSYLIPHTSNLKSSNLKPQILKPQTSNLKSSYLIPYILRPQTSDPQPLRCENPPRADALSWCRWKGTVNTPTSLGLLCLALGDGSVLVLSVPHPEIDCSRR